MKLPGPVKNIPEVVEANGFPSLDDIASKVSKSIEEKLSGLSQNVISPGFKDIKEELKKGIQKPGNIVGDIAETIENAKDKIETIQTLFTIMIFLFFVVAILLAVLLCKGPLVKLWGTAIVGVQKWRRRRWERKGRPGQDERDLSRSSIEMKGVDTMDRDHGHSSEDLTWLPAQMSGGIRQPPHAHQRNFKTFGEPYRPRSGKHHGGAAIHEDDYYHRGEKGCDVDDQHGDGVDLPPCRSSLEQTRPTFQRRHEYENSGHSRT